MDLPMLETQAAPGAPGAPAGMPPAAEPTPAAGVAVFIYQDEESGTLAVGTVPAAAVIDLPSNPAKDRKDALTQALEILRNGKPGAEQPPPDGNFQAGYEED